MPLELLKQALIFPRHMNEEVYSDGEETSWSNEFICEVDDEYIQESFNLSGLTMIMILT